MQISVRGNILSYERFVLDYFMTELENEEAHSTGIAYSVPFSILNN